MKNYSAGEAARKLKVSLRTIQYYDHHGIVSPSPKEHHLYTAADIQKLQLAMLYQKLGFEIKDIRKMMHSTHPDLWINDILRLCRGQLEQDISRKQTQLKKIQGMQEDIKKEGSLATADQQALVMMLHTKKARSRTQRQLAGYLLFLLISFPVCLYFQRPLLAILLSMAGLLWLLIHHAGGHRYLCSRCRHLFTLPWYRDLLSPHDQKKGKYVCCPYCHQRGWMPEISEKASIH